MFSNLVCKYKDEKLLYVLVQFNRFLSKIEQEMN